MSQTHGTFNGYQFEIPGHFDAEQRRQLLIIAGTVDQEICEQDVSEEGLEIALPATDKVALDQLVMIINSQAEEGLSASWWNSDEVGKEGTVVFRIKMKSEE